MIEFQHGCITFDGSVIDGTTNLFPFILDNLHVICAICKFGGKKLLLVITIREGDKQAHNKPLQGKLNPIPIAKVVVFYPFTRFSNWTVVTLGPLP